MRRSITDHALTSIEPTRIKCSDELEISNREASSVAARLATEDRSRSSVLDQNPSHRPTVVRRHDVVNSNGSSGCRESDYLPYPALRTAFARMGSGAEGFPRHIAPTFPFEEGKMRDASRLIDSRASRILKLDIEPRGSLFADCCVPVAFRTTVEVL